MTTQNDVKIQNDLVRWSCYQKPKTGTVDCFETAQTFGLRWPSQLAKTIPTLAKGQGLDYHIQWVDDICQVSVYPGHAVHIGDKSSGNTDELGVEFRIPAGGRKLPDSGLGGTVKGLMLSGNGLSFVLDQTVKIHRRSRLTQSKSEAMQTPNVIRQKLGMKQIPVGVRNDVIKSVKMAWELFLEEARKANAQIPGCVEIEKAPIIKIVQELPGL